MLSDGGGCLQARTAGLVPVVWPMHRASSALRLPAGEGSALALILPYPSATYANPGVPSSDFASPQLAIFPACFWI